MNELLARVRGAFVEPAPACRARPAAEPGVPTVAVLCPPRQALALGSAVALALMGGHRAATGLVGLWTPGARPGAWRAPGSRRAQRLAVSLHARRVPAQPAGRLVRAFLPSGAGAAVASAGRALAATRAPAVLALAGPREDAVDGLLADVDLILVARGGEEELVRLAASRLATLGPPVELLELDLPPATRLLATAGLPLPAPRPLRAALEAAR